ncbi:ankyrin repeat domain-containing protein 39 [Biomphalaria glabrata]|nr:ankyrin repeat domain-containing protein 39 [Biomphalaria glabrata]
MKTTNISLAMSKDGGAHNHSCSQKEDHQCLSHLTNSSLHQTLDELDFDRGLWASALAGDNLDIKHKLQKGNSVDVNSRDKYGYTALHYASRNGHLPVCQTLLNYHADVNIATQGSGTTPLHRAAYMGHTEIVELLLAHCADPMAQDCDGMTPLHKSAENGKVQTFKILLRNNPKTIDITDSKGRTPLEVATSEEIQLMLKSIIQDRNVKGPD